METQCPPAAYIVNPVVLAGDQVEFVQMSPARYEFVAATRSVIELKGMFGKPAKSVSIQDMNNAIKST